MAPARAQPAPAVEPVFTTSGAFFAASVADLDASILWYRDKLGMRVIMRPPPRDGVTMALLSGGGLEVELIHDPAARPLREVAPAIRHATHVHGIFKAGIRVDDWDRLVATLRARGVPIAVGPFPARADQRANLMIRDNEGNYIQFFGDFATRP
ncbi:MAG TPA: VOC family protein [Allosphingosinicella sp.]|nr:VOC family protein [Allosphingosinicella sp.]